MKTLNYARLLIFALALSVGGFIVAAPSEASAQHRDVKRKRTVKKRTVRHKKQTKRPRKKTVVKRPRKKTVVRRGTTVKRRTVVRHNYAPHRSYRYVRYPRYRHVYVTPHTRWYYRSHHHYYHDRNPDIVVVEVEKDPEYPELDCPVRTEMVQNERETYCATSRGNRHGPYVRYFENGEVSAEGLYEYGTREGFWVEYYNTGVVKLEGEYRDGDRVGTWIRFDTSGTEKSVTEYH